MASPCRSPVLSAAALSAFSSCLGLAGCGDPGAREPRSPASAAPAREPQAEIHPNVPLLISRGNTTSVACPSTGTALSVPAAWQPRLERLSDSEAVIECRECGGVLEVTAARGEVDVEGILSRLVALHERLTGRQLDDITVSGVRTDGNHAEVHYVEGVVSEGTPPGESFVLNGLIARRDDASCSVLVVETEAAWKNRSALSPLLKGVVDSPWRDVREHEQARSDAAEFLRLMLTVGAYTVKAVPR